MAEERAIGRGAHTFPRASAVTAGGLPLRARPGPDRHPPDTDNAGPAVTFRHGSKMVSAEPAFRHADGVSAPPAYHHWLPHERTGWHGSHAQRASQFDKRIAPAVTPLATTGQRGRWSRTPRWQPEPGPRSAGSRRQGRGAWDGHWYAHTKRRDTHWHGARGVHGHAAPRERDHHGNAASGYAHRDYHYPSTSNRHCHANSHTHANRDLYADADSHRDASP